MIAREKKRYERETICQRPLLRWRIVSSISEESVPMGCQVRREEHAQENTANVATSSLRGETNMRKDAKKRHASFFIQSCVLSHWTWSASMKIAKPNYTHENVKGR